MRIFNKLLLGTIGGALLYRWFNFKIGPCSPEMEDILSDKDCSVNNYEK